MLSLECVPRLHLRKNTDLATAARTAKSLQARTLEKRLDGYFAAVALPDAVPDARDKTMNVGRLAHANKTHVCSPTCNVYTAFAQDHIP